MRDDFEYVCELISEFFSRSRTQQALRIINAAEITGWEIWFQIEFAQFLANHGSGLEWWREWPIEYDYRKESIRWFLKPDFIIRKKGWRLESYAAVEIKQHPDAGACINNMLRDAHKIARARISELDIRCFYALGITSRERKSILHHKIRTRFEQCGWDFDPDSVKINVIPKTPYSFLLF